jgi:chemotaxis protein methyltransferase CheR
MHTTFAIADVTPTQLKRFAALIYEKIGVSFSPQKATLLSNRLRRRMRETSHNDYDAYYDMLISSPISHPEWQSFLQEITTHETYLFRDESHWKWFRDEFLPRLRIDADKGLRPKSLRCWSAACSTGDEAASMACCIAEAIPAWREWKIEIVGTDVGSGAVAQAAEARFGIRAMRNVTSSQRRRHFEPLPNDEYVLNKSLKSLLQFRVHNLLHPLPERAFDVVFLKNVLIYFDRSSKQRVIASLQKVLKKGSLLVTGASEGVGDLLGDFRSQYTWLHCYQLPGRG